MLIRSAWPSSRRKVFARKTLCCSSLWWRDREGFCDFARGRSHKHIEFRLRRLLREIACRIDEAVKTKRFVTAIDELMKFERSDVNYVIR